MGWAVVTVVGGVEGGVVRQVGSFDLKAFMLPRYSISTHIFVYSYEVFFKYVFMYVLRIEYFRLDDWPGFCSCWKKIHSKRKLNSKLYLTTGLLEKKWYRFNIHFQNGEDFITSYWLANKRSD